MNVYHIVVHRPYVDISKTISRVAENCNQLAVYDHPANKRECSHTHWYLSGFTKTVERIKQWITEELGVKLKRTEWAFMTTITKGAKKGLPVDLDCLSYFHKGQYPCVFSQNITPETFSEKHLVSYKPKTDETTAKGSHTDRQLAKKGLTHWDIVEWVRDKAKKEEYLGRDPDIGMVHKTRFASYSEVYDLLVIKLEELKIKTHQSDLERWFATIVRTDQSCQIKYNILQKYSKPEI